MENSLTCPSTPRWNSERPFLTGRFHQENKTTSRFAETKGYSVDSFSLGSEKAIGCYNAAVQELIVIDDLLSALVGIEGRYISIKRVRGKEDSFSFQVDTSMDLALQELAKRIFPLCESFMLINYFVESRSQFKNGLVNHAFAAALRALLLDYQAMVAQLEHQFRLGRLSLQGLWFFCQPMMGSMQALYTVIRKASANNFAGSAVLNLLQSQAMAMAGDNAVRSLLEKMVQCASNAYLGILERWVYEGVIDDPYGEFFIAENKSLQKESLTQDYDARYWRQRYSLKDGIPSFLANIAGTILTTGKYLNVMRECGHHVQVPASENTKLMSFGTNHHYLECIKAAYDFASNELLNLVKEKYDLMGKLRSIKHYLLLDQGDFLVHFMDIARDELTKKLDEISVEKLQSLLDLALRTTAAAADPCHEDLTCCVETSSLLKRLGTLKDLGNSRTAPAGNDLEEPVSVTGLETFSLSYKVRWPLSIVISRKMGIWYLMLLFYFIAIGIAIPSSHAAEGRWQSNSRKVIDVEGGPESVVWVVQLSDLHFSVHHPDRAIDFKRIVGPALSFINPSLVLITGDLTDGKSKDLLTMKQNEEEWLEYQNVMEDVIKKSRLDKSIFFDLRGNHDNFGVPVVGGSFDFFSKYSINAQLGRNTNINSVTLQTGEKKHLFVGVDSTMAVGLRGPTNLFGHPTDKLLAELDKKLSQWDSQSTEPVTKISFGHFPLSFSAQSNSGKSLEDIFLRHSLSAYICGHLHTRFGKNLKRHHQLTHHFSSLQNFFQFNVHQDSYDSILNCSSDTKEFWEWEIGDWRKSRAMRILAIDRGHVSYVDIDFKLGGKKTIILPTFPLDSRFMSTSSTHRKYGCQKINFLSYETVRALVFSASPIVSVVARVYDSSPGDLNLVMEASMKKVVDNTSRGDLYIAPWNYKAFEDPSPDRFWLQIEATDIMGRLSLTDLSPFSINGLNAKLSWTWREFLVMGCQWAALYYPLLWSTLYFMLSILLIPKAVSIFSKKQFTYMNFVADKGFINCIGWLLQEICKVSVVWFGILTYLFYLVTFPWFIGRVFTDGKDKGYMIYMGWVVKSIDQKGKHEYIGSPDIMVIVLSHLFYVVLPSLLVTIALAAEKSIYRDYYLSLSGKKVDDYDQEQSRSLVNGQGIKKSRSYVGKRWIRKVLLVVILTICWKHFMNCKALVKAYEMNPLFHFPGYSFTIPLLLAYAFYKTREV